MDAVLNNPTSVDENIRLRGVRVHNLRNIDLDVPRDKLVVITGPSGSGKSSLAFDTLYAEGQRQFIESLSTYARQFLNQLERPDVDLIEGLQPTICIDQRAGSHHPRSTVATVTEIYDYLRLLVARLGDASCHQCGAAIRQQSAEEIVERLAAMPAGTKVVVLAPLVRGRRGQHPEVFAAIRKAGFVRVRVDGELHEIDAVPSLSTQKNHTIEAVVDRIVIREGVLQRLAESVRLAVRHGDGLVVVCLADSNSSVTPPIWRDESFSTLYACPDCKISYQEIEPRTFSFNSPFGACPLCEGLGRIAEFDRKLVLPNASLSLADGAVAVWKGASAAVKKTRLRETLDTTAALDIPADLPLEQLTDNQSERLWYGDGDSLRGLLGLLRQALADADDDERLRLEQYRGPSPCPACQGSRLRPEARSVRLAGLAIHDITALTVTSARDFFARLSFSGGDSVVAKSLLGEIRARIEFLDQAGLNYLTLDRSAASLSGGESQRIRLAAGMGSPLAGVCYILDEPSQGLHPRDNARLIGAMRALRDRGNSVLVVEHDEALMRQSDRLLDLGPGAGVHGGRIVSQGTPLEVMQDPNSLTGRYLSGEMSIPVPAARRPVQLDKRSIVLEGARANNLKDVTARFPLGALTCVTGVSGSGKSTLLNGTLARAVRRQLEEAGPLPGEFASLRGLQHIDKFIQVDQSPIGRTPRSNPATYTGLFDEIRKVFATTREARLRGYKTGRFSFNVKGGRCEECQGHGQKKIEMNFLPDLHIPCPACRGKRFNRQTLEVRYRGKNLADVLDLTIEAAVQFFENFPAMRRTLYCLQEVGLGYLTLGQSSATLSGGEAQRIKLATELGRVDTGRTLYLLDEPTTGLHFDDVRKLLDVLSRLVEAGNTAIVIEHHLDVMKTADWIIDLGPEGGANGGAIVATGTPEEIAAIADNITGQHLREALARSIK